MSNALSEMLNQFGICECCKEHGADRNESVYCEKCYDHVKECNDCLDDAFWLIHRIISQFAKKYQNDEEFWNILLGH
jgi:hypothetical protein